MTFDPSDIQAIARLRIDEAAVRRLVAAAVSEAIPGLAIRPDQVAARVVDGVFAGFSIRLKGVAIVPDDALMATFVDESEAAAAPGGSPARPARRRPWLVDRLFSVCRVREAAAFATLSADECLAAFAALSDAARRDGCDCGESAAAYLRDELAAAGLAFRDPATPPPPEALFYPLAVANYGPRATEPLRRFCVRSGASTLADVAALSAEARREVLAGEIRDLDPVDSEWCLIRIQQVLDRYLPPPANGRPG